MMKLNILTFLTLASATSSAFVPPHQLAHMRALKSTMTPSSFVGTTKEEKTLFNEDKFLADMDQALNELKPAEAKEKKIQVPYVDPIPADRLYVTQARMRIAALADRADERIEHFAWESKELKSKSVWDSFRTTYVPPEMNLVRYVNTDAALAAAVQVETVSSTSTTSSGKGWIGLAMVLAVASVVEPATVTDFVGSMNLDLDLPKFHLNMDLTLAQEQAQANVALMLVSLKEMQTMLEGQVAEAQMASTAQFQTLVDSSALQMNELDLSSRVQELQATVASQVASSQETLARVAAQMESSTATVQSELVASVSTWKDTAMSAQNGWFGSVQALASNVQEQASNAFKSMGSNFQGVQQTLASKDWESSAPSVLTSAGEDLRAMLRE